MAEKARRIVLINRRFQLKLIIKFILVNLLVMVLFGISIYFFLNSELDANLKTAHVTYKNLKDMLLPVILTLSVMNILVSSVIISIIVLYASHKIAGPMYRFNTAINDICDKRLNTVASVREGDQLYECSDSLQKLISALALDISQIREKVSELKSNLANSGMDASAAEKIRELEYMLGEYKY